MKIIINTSNLYVGGGVQVALSFINELKNIDSQNEYHIFLSKATEKQISQHEFDKRFYFYLIENSPAKLKTRSSILKKLDYLESQINPDIVLSVFGPTYWTPKSKHIMGFAVPWVLAQDSIAYDELKPLKRFKMRLWVKYISYYTKINASNYIIETNDGKEKLSKVLNINSENIYVVSNTYSSVFNDKQYIESNHSKYIKLPEKEKDEFRLLLISHNHPNKNLKIINKILPLLKHYNVKFVLTINQNDYELLFEKESKNIINLGPVSQDSCPSLYSQCDAMFLPTLLEVFSASYPEAMKMEKPILTSDLSFARDVCGDAASYFNPLNENDISDKIIELVQNKNLRDELIDNGIKKLKTFETSKSRAEKYLEICKLIIKKEENNVQK